MHHTLPFDVFVHILSFLPPEEIGPLAQVSKAWRRASRNQSLWERICRARGVLNGSLDRYRHILSTRGRAYDQQLVLTTLKHTKSAAAFLNLADLTRIEEISKLANEATVMAQHSCYHPIPGMISNLSVLREDMDDYQSVIVKFEYLIPGGNSVLMMNRIWEMGEGGTDLLLQALTDPPVNLIAIPSHEFNVAALRQLRGLGGHQAVSLFDFSCALFSCGYEGSVYLEDCSGDFDIE